jgi:hypothetical protein
MCKYFPGGLTSILSVNREPRVELWRMTPEDEVLLLRLYNECSSKRATKAHCIRWLEEHGYRKKYKRRSDSKD